MRACEENHSEFHWLHQAARSSCSCGGKLAVPARTDGASSLALSSNSDYRSSSSDRSHSTTSFDLFDLHYC